MSKQLETFKSNLEEFASKHKQEIRKSSQFRVQFQEMCATIGVDPLACENHEEFICLTTLFFSLVEAESCYIFEVEYHFLTACFFPLQLAKVFGLRCSESVTSIMSSASRLLKCASLSNTETEVCNMSMKTEWWVSLDHSFPSLYFWQYRDTWTAIFYVMDTSLHQLLHL